MLGIESADHMIDTHNIMCRCYPNIQIAGVIRSLVKSLSALAHSETERHGLAGLRTRVQESGMARQESSQKREQIRFYNALIMYRRCSTAHMQTVGLISGECIILCKWG